MPTLADNHATQRDTVHLNTENEQDHLGVQVLSH